LLRHRPAGGSRADAPAHAGDAGLDHRNRARPRGSPRRFRRPIGMAIGEMLATPRLTLLPCSPEHLLALIDRPEEFERLVGLPLADGLHGFYVSADVSQDWLNALRSASQPAPWRHGFFVVPRETPSVIGSAGFKGPPDSAGTVEIAYGIVPGFAGRVCATQAGAARGGLA